MSTKELLEKIKKLPVESQIEIVTQTMKSIDKVLEDKMIIAADELHDDYKNDKELTAFTEIDLDNFYEAR
jgi:hypothetical protein